MRKIWVLRYNNGTADVWDEEQGPPSWPYVDALDAEKRIKELKSDYDELRERVAWMMECEDCPLRNSTEPEKWGFDALWKTRYAARKAVEEML